MKTTTLDPQFLQAVILMTDFKVTAMVRVKAALLMLGLKVAEFTAADLPDAITGGSKHISGAATGSLISIGLLKVTDRVKSPDPKAKGRKLDVLTVTDASRAKSWLKANSFLLPEEMSRQLNLFS